MEPLSGTDVPFNIALTAFLVVHVMTDDSPGPIDDTLALTPAAGTISPVTISRSGAPVPMAISSPGAALVLSRGSQVQRASGPFS